MDCHVIQPHLVPYHFGLIDDAERLAVEEHLLACPHCLRDFITLKREMETSDARPSAAAKARLREAVTREVRRPRVAWSWWERPLAFAVASVVIVVAGSLVHTLATSDGAAPKTLMTP